MKRVALVAAHFPPSNFAAVHRARLWAGHLHEFGWEPVIVTTHWRHFEEVLDWELCKLIDPDLNIIRTPAIPTRPVRLIGDVGIRGLPWHLSALRRLFREQKIDFLHITIPSFYSALLGALLYRRQPIPFGIDYIDPWVHVVDGERRLSKTWLSMRLAKICEPWAVRHAVLITGVAEAYFAGVLQRNPHLNAEAVTSAMPYGNSERDFDLAAKAPSQQPYLFDAEDGNFHIVYAGAILPKAHAVLDRLLQALAIIRSETPHVFSRVRLHFIGTGRRSSDPAGYTILPRARHLGLAGIITEHPQRIPYVDVLRHLLRASAILILGSTEPHYTPSKIYQAIQAKRPLFALLHEASSAVRIIESSRAGVVVSLREGALPEPSALAVRLGLFIGDPGYNPQNVKWSAFGAFSARESARQLALALDVALDRFSLRSR
jgi:glycosyltransferase involved in cell wall biosynthesis